jgi:hypothetical protein
MQSTIITANKKYNDLPILLKTQGRSNPSLPSYSKDRTDKQRGDGVLKVP